MAQFIEFWVKVQDDDGKIYLHPVATEEVEAVLKGLKFYKTEEK